MKTQEEENIDQLNREYSLVQNRYNQILLENELLLARLNNIQAKEYLRFGVSRRFKILNRCMRNIFNVFPPDRVDLLNSQELSDIDINLHSFIFNLSGLLDCIAWVIVSERCEKVLSPRQVGLFSKETYGVIPKELRVYIDSEKTRKWHREYLLYYRHALAHRIPPYVPPKLLNPDQIEATGKINDQIRLAIEAKDFTLVDQLQNEEDAIGSICPAFVCSVDHSRAMQLHTQLLSDFKTVEEIATIFRKSMMTPDDRKQRLEESNPSSKFKETILAYFDILGYEKLVSKMLQDQELVKDMQNLLFNATQGLYEKYRNIPDLQGYAGEDKKLFLGLHDQIKVRVFSDSVIFTLKVETQDPERSKLSLRMFFNCIAATSRMFVGKTGFLLRGCVTKGPHYEDAKHPDFSFFVSPPLIEAYRQVEKIDRAEKDKFPTAIVVHPNLWPWLEQHVDGVTKQYFKFKNEYICLDMYLNMPKDDETKLVLEEIKKGVLLNYKENKHDLQVVKKFVSFAELHNEKVNIFGWPGLTIDLE